MIVVRLMGGLGNQMFQYALGRRLSLERGVPLKLDLGWFEDHRRRGGDTVREYALGRWRIAAEAALPEDLARFGVVASPGGRLARLFRRVMPGRGRDPAIFERRPGFDESVLRARAPAYFSGYWQSEKYFKPIADILRREFSLADAPCPHVAELARGASDRRTVSLHVRRGDYIRNPSTHAFHGVCSPAYYAAAVSLIAAKAPDSRFLVFSDEPDWARKNLRLDWPVSVVEHRPGCSPHDEMWLMSRCSHHVIANSSFSWWGAWLCEEARKTVVAPKAWFSDPSLDTADLVPESWIRI